MSLSASSTPVQAETYSLWRAARLATFQIGSAMGEILTASVWNRVMISDLGMLATPVGFLLALQYVLIPVSLWAGHRSDVATLWGWRRTGYIWLGRGLMLPAFPLLGLSIRAFEAGQMTTGWVLSTLAFLLFGVGKLMSGSVYLALVRESAPPARQGLSIALVETVLITAIPISAYAFSRWMEQYDPLIFWEMILGVTLVGGFFWWLGVVRVEQRTSVAPTNPGRPALGHTFRAIWADGRARRFFLFLALATFAAWMQDNILEPFGGDILDLPAGATTRFTSYWGGATVLVLLACFFIWRRRRPEQTKGIAGWGLAVMALGMFLLAGVAWTHQAQWVTLCLVVYGAGFGLYTFGGLNLMAVMSGDRDAGAYLGLWTIAVLLFKGMGTFSGGVVRDLVFGASPTLAYALVFGLAGLGLAAAIVVLRPIDIVGFGRDYGRPLD